MQKSALACPRIVLGVALVALSIIGPVISTSHAQRVRARVLNPNAPVSEDDDSGPGNFAPPDRNILQVLARSKKALAEHRYGEALEGLAEILRGNEDYFYQPDRKLSIYRSLKTEAQQLLGQMPREGRDLYEVRSGAEARDRLKRAVVAGDATALSEISSQFFHTQAGYEATYLLALYNMDHSRPLAGALSLKRLREAGSPAEGFEPGLSLTQAACFYQAGMIKECQQVLIDLKRRNSRPSLQLDGHEVPWFDQDNDAAEWLARLTKVRRMLNTAETDQWTMFRGDPARNATTVGSAPLLNLRWRTDVTNEPTLQPALQQQQAEYREHGFNVLSGLHPLAIGDLVLMRTTTELLAVDFKTGKRLWSTDSEVEQNEIQPNRFNGFITRNNMSQPAQYGQRIWDDATYGTISSDGARVYVIEQLSLGVTGQYNFIMVGGGRGDQATRAVTNKLTAYEIATNGKHVWSLGGEDAVGQPGAQPDTFFLGPPLPLRGQLFVMAEVKDEIRLLALEAATGKEIWHQQLAMVESNISQDPVRRLAGVSPSYADGILICPTGSGCVVAVDLASHSLLWGNIYPHPGEQQNGRRWRGMNQVQQQFMNPQGPVPRWLDGTAMIVGGRVLLTPAEADMLYCLNLADGKLLWAPQSRNDHYYIACVHQGVVVLVGRNSMDAINLEDGSKAWGGASIPFPSGASASGHGFCAADRYYLPLSSGEVIAVDLNAGKIVATAKSRHSAVPGNLVSYRGHIISQGADGVELYYQADAARGESARLLAQNPDSVEGLTLRGEIAMDEGRSSDAVADFRRAYAIDEKSDSHIRTRELLRDALLSGLHDNFALHRSLASELEKLLDDPVQKATYLRYMTMGLQRAGDWQQAVEFCLRLVDMDDKKLTLEPVDRSYLARRDRWVQARLAMLRSDGGAAAAAEIDKALQPRLDEAKLDTGAESLERFVGFFDGQPQAIVARVELLKRLADSGHLLEAELLMSSAVDSSDHKAQAVLLADMAGMYLRANRPDDAAACYRQLARQYAGVACQGNLTPAAWLAAVPGGDALRKQINTPPAAWPKGLVEVAGGESSGNYVNRGVRFDMNFSGPAGPFFTDYTVGVESNQQEISLRDGLGHIMKSPIRLVENGRAYGFAYNPNSTLARTCGHLLVVSVGTKIYALDPFRASGDSRQILWSQDLTDATSDNGMNINGGVLQLGNANGMGFVSSVNGTFRANPFGPVNARVVCFQRIRNLVAVDPLTGEQLWVRQDIPQNSEVFGDDQYVFVLSPGKPEVTVYRATDGEFLGTRKMPQTQAAESAYGYYPGSYEGNERTSTLGITGSLTLSRYVLTWTKDAESNGRILTLYDPWLQKSAWPERSFASGSRIDIVEQNTAAIFEQDGHFVLVDLHDGHTLADVRLKMRDHLHISDLLVTRLGDQYIILAQDRRSTVENNNNEDQVQAPQGMLGYNVRFGRIWAIDMQGKLAWPEPADVDHQQFLLSQPGRLPVLLFCSFHFDRRGGQNNMRTALVAVDRHDGRIVCDKNEVGPMSSMGLDAEGDPADKAVHIRANTENVTLHFTEKPLGKAVRVSSGNKKPPTKLGDALLEAVQRAAGLPQ